MVTCTQLVASLFDHAALMTFHAGREMCWSTIGYVLVWGTLGCSTPMWILQVHSDTLLPRSMIQGLSIEPVYDIPLPAICFRSHKLLGT